MKKFIKNILTVVLTLLALTMSFQAHAITLWVGQSYEWDFGSSVMGSTYNMNVSVSGGYLNVTGSGFYRKITPTQYFSGTATVTAEWDYTLYYGGKMQHQRVSVSISCYENPVSISKSNVTLSPGETYQLGYSHLYSNQYVGAANAYFSGGNSHFTVSSNGLITAISPGTGNVNVYSKVSDASKAPSCFVTVKEVEPTGASSSAYTLLADQTIDLKANVSPSNASVKSTQWSVKSGSDVVSISGNRLTGLKPGTATIYCTINGNVRSNDASVTVNEPKLTMSNITPESGSSGISVFANPSVTYSHAISKGSEFDKITLSSGTQVIDGRVEISGTKLTFLPDEPLSPKTKYTLKVPRKAVLNKWDSPAQQDVTATFTTGELEKISLSFAPTSGSFISANESVRIISEPSDAIIYYTTDGSAPTVKSAVYKDKIEIPNDLSIKAIAKRAGYLDSDVIVGDFFKSQSEIVEYYPNDNTPLFNYSDVNPFVRLSGGVVKSNNFRRIIMTKDSGENVDGLAYLAANIIVFVPDEPLENVTTYKIDIPYDAIKTENGEVFKGFNWTFTTPNLPVSVAMQGDETVFILSENGKLKSRGMYIKSADSSGEIKFEDRDNFVDYLENVNTVSSGYSHSAIRIGDHATKFAGINYCGELGESNFTPTWPVSDVKAGFQTSAVILDDNSLWMCGRNDFYQLLANNGTHSAKLIKVLDNIRDVALGNGFTFYIDNDNVLWGVGRNHLGQLGDGTTIDRKEPVKIMEDADEVYVSKDCYFTACITIGGDLYLWGDNSQSQIGKEDVSDSTKPVFVMSDVEKVALGSSHVLALRGDNNLYAWGNNSSHQISAKKGNISTPALLAENVLDMDAGPNTSLILHLNGEAVGMGKKTHSNFGTGSGNTSGLTINEGCKFQSLKDAYLMPYRFEIKPDSEFAFSAVPQPLHADYEYIEWSSSDPDIAFVEGNGIVHSLKLGETTVTAKFFDRHGNSKGAQAVVVCTNTPDNSDVISNLFVSEISDSHWSVSASGLILTVHNAVPGEIYEIFNTQGLRIEQSKAMTRTVTFEMPEAGVFIVRSGDKVRKAVCR